MIKNVDFDQNCNLEAVIIQCKFEVRWIVSVVDLTKHRGGVVDLTKHRGGSKFCFHGLLLPLKQSMHAEAKVLMLQRENKMQPTNPNAFTWNTFVKQVNLKSLVFFPLLPCQCTVDCGMWNGVERKVWSVKKVGCWVGNVLCCVECGVWIVECRV